MTTEGSSTSPSGGDADLPVDADVDADVEALLGRFVARRQNAAADNPGEARIGEVARVAVGLSRENWVFDLTTTEGGKSTTRPLIVRRDPPGGLLDTDRATEFAVLQALEPTTIPAPRALWLDADGAELGRPSLIMERGHGTCDYFVLNGPLTIERRVALAERFCDLLADIHGLDWRALGLDEVLPDPGPNAAGVALEEWVAALRAHQVEPLPELELIVDWLGTAPPRSPRTVLVHGDFKAGNMLLDEHDGIVLLLDWELTHLGDPHDDLGWITQPLRTREHLIAGHWERPQLFARYTAGTGHEVDEAAVRWWNVMACFKTAVMQVTGLASWLDDRTETMYRLTNGCVLAALDLMDR